MNKFHVLPLLLCMTLCAAKVEQNPRDPGQNLSDLGSDLDGIAGGANIQILRRMNYPYVVIARRDVVPLLRRWQDSLIKFDVPGLMALMDQGSLDVLFRTYGNRGLTKDLIPSRLEQDMKIGVSPILLLNRMYKYRGKVGEPDVVWVIIPEPISNPPEYVFWSIALLDRKISPFEKDPQVFHFGIVEEDSGKFRVRLENLPDFGIHGPPSAFP